MRADVEERDLLFSNYAFSDFIVDALSCRMRGLDHFFQVETNTAKPPES